MKISPAIVIQLEEENYAAMQTILDEVDLGELEKKLDRALYDQVIGLYAGIFNRINPEHV